jgi:cysteine dioxygenase
MRSPVHDHAEAHCLMKIIKGTLRERRWAMPQTGHEREMTLTSDKTFKEGGVAYMSDEMGVHEIGNPSEREFAVSLHCEFSLASHTLMLQKTNSNSVHTT